MYIIKNNYGSGGGTRASFVVILGHNNSNKKKRQNCHSAFRLISISQQLVNLVFNCCVNFIEENIHDLQ